MTPFLSFVDICCNEEDDMIPLTKAFASDASPVVRGLYESVPSIVMPYFPVLGFRVELIL